MGRVKSAHPSEDVEETLGGVSLPVPRLPQVQDGLGGAGSGGKKCNVSVNIEPLGEHSPVIPKRHWGIQHPGQGLLGGGG